MSDKGEIILYKTEEGKAALDVRLEDQTVWLTQAQMVNLFGKTKQNISLHIRNIFRERELREDSVVKEYLTTAADGKAYKTTYYNLDVIISVGYRVKSKRGTQFRIWATNVLRDHIVKGYTLDQKRLQENEQRRLKELEQLVELTKTLQATKDLSAVEAAGLLNVVTEYTRTWLLLHQYDSGTLTPTRLTTEVPYELTYPEATRAIVQLKKNLVAKKEASDLFGVERDEALKGILGSLNQTFGGRELYASVEEKAAHLLYFVIKDHPFADGNKRIASLLFIWFLDRNGVLHASDGKRKFNDNALVALALLVAESNPKQKDVLIPLIMRLSGEEQ